MKPPLQRAVVARLIPVFVTALAIGCAEPPPPPRETPNQDVMRGAPLFRPSQITADSRTKQAVQWTLRTSVSADSVARWYRRRVLDLGWHIGADTPLPDGGMSLYVQRDGPDLWIMVHPSGTGAEFTLIGAATDSTAADSDSVR